MPTNIIAHKIYSNFLINSIIMEITEGMFHSWLEKTQSQITKPDRYSKTIITISNHLKNKNISDVDLFLVNSYDEVKKLYQLYFKNTDLSKKNKRGKHIYSRAFDLYIEFLEENLEYEDTKYKTEFTELEANEIKKLIRQKLAASPKEQKRIRDKIRNEFKFKYSNFASNRPYTVEDFERLVKSGKIKVIKNGITKIPFNDEITDTVLGKNESKLQGELIKPKKPLNGKYTKYPDKKYSFKGVKKDYNAEHEKKQYIGEQGERLVIRDEKKKLLECGRADLAKKVVKVKDGEGYDILSFDKNGDIIYIEVKTTKGNSDTPFSISDNELEFMRQNNEQYRIYRIYEYKITSNTGKLDIITDVENNIIYRSTQFEAQRKKI